MRSACDLLLNKTYEEIWYRGEKYADTGKVKMKHLDNQCIDAIVKGTDKYHVQLEFRSGGIGRKCDCPYMESHSDRAICKHMVAVAIVWDEVRGIGRPTKKEIEAHTIAPPEVSSQEIDYMFQHPLKADLDVLRILADETALGGKPRPHARLPKCPRIDSNSKKPLTLKEVESAFSQIEKWTRRRSYDFYFCSGEMVAAFCEIMRIIKGRLSATPLLLAADILREAQKFHYKLVMELIDDSNGLHTFTEAYLDDIYQDLKKMTVSERDKEVFNQKLEEFDNHRDDY